MRLNLHTPWGYWAFLKGVPRLEVLMHSIHYLDLIRSLIGEPAGVYCRGVRHPELGDYPDVRTSIILDYGDVLRCSLTMNHTHDFGPRFAVSQLKVEGTHGAAIAKMGVNLNYPHGEPDELLRRDRGGGLGRPCRCADRGSWRRSRGRCRNLQRVVAGEDAALVSPRRGRVPHDGGRRGVLRVERARRHADSGGSEHGAAHRRAPALLALLRRRRTRGSTTRWRRCKRDFLPDDLEPLLRDAGFDGCVAVQAQQDVAETEWLLALADEHAFIRGVVGWVDLRATTCARPARAAGGAPEARAACATSCRTSRTTASCCAPTSCAGSPRSRSSAWRTTS